MIHTQYYALMRGISQSLQAAIPHTTINQWDYNYNSKTFDSVKLHRNPLPYPKGIINISSIQKQFVYPLAQNASVGMNAADLLQMPNAFPVASIYEKFEIYALTNRYNINVEVTIDFETGAQLLDFYHAYNEYYPGEGKYFYDFEYDYFLYLPSEIVDGYDPTSDEAINIFAQMKDDASNFELFSKCISTPLMKCESVTLNQDKNSDMHSVNINFVLQDSFVYMLLSVDASRWARALSMDINIKVADYDESVNEDVSLGTYELDDTALPDFTSDASSDIIGDSLVENTATNNNTTIEKVE